MASVYSKRGTWWARVKGDKEPGKWSGVPTGYALEHKAAAIEFAEEAQRSIDKRNGIQRAGTFRDYVEEWLVKRREAGHEWAKDRGKFDNHILPSLGSLRIADITTKHVADLVHALRFRKRLANRTTRNIYSVLAAAMRDAKIDGLITQTPCILTDVQLGAIVDKDPEWRAGAVFTRAEAEAMISDPRIPLDRRVVYGFGLLAGLRPGEGAALRWRHYDATPAPLGRLRVALSYSTTRFIEKGTKTETTKSIPVHAALAELLDEWRATGWAEMMGRAPGPEDLIVPLPPDVKLIKRTGERFRGFDYSGRRWRELDLPMLGWRERSLYDTKSTFITLALEDGASRAIIRDRITHTKPHRSAFDGYDRGEHWIETCREVSKLAIRRLATTLLPPAETSLNSNDFGSEGGYRMVGQDFARSSVLRVVEGGREVIPSECDHAMAALVARLRPRQTEERDSEDTLPVGAKLERLR